MSTTSTGRAAEQIAAGHLESHGFTVLDRNWRNRWCELDIVARKNGAIHFVEVKYRATSYFGHPADYITRDKTRRLIRASLAWNQAHFHTGPYQIDVLSVTGRIENPVIEYLPNAVSAD